MGWVCGIVSQHKFQRIECPVLDEIGGAQGHYFDVVLHCDRAQQAINVAFPTGSQRKSEFAFPVNRYASNGLPRFSSNLYTDAVLLIGSDVLEALMLKPNRLMTVF